MKIVIGGSQPIYLQIYSQLVRQISDGTLKADECLPSIRTVARQLQIGVITVKSAYEKLESDGFIYTVQGKGCFVKGGSGGNSDKRLSSARERLKDAADYCRSLGLDIREFLALAEQVYSQNEIKKDKDG